MKIIVTGGGGFLGQYVFDEATRRGHTVMVCDRAKDGCDVQDFDLEPGADTVIHLAGTLGTSELFDTPNEAVDVNIKGTLSVLDWCRRNAAGFVGITMPDSSWANVYQATKLCASRLATAWHVNFGVPVSHVRAFNAYGPGQKYGPGHPQKIIPTFAMKAWRGEPLPVWGDGLQTADLVHAKDVARMLVDATRFGDDEVFDAGTGVPFTVRRIAQIVNRYAGQPEDNIEYLPMRPGERENTNIVALGEGWDLLDWRPEVDLEALRATVNWYMRPGLYSKVGPAPQ